MLIQSMNFTMDVAGQFSVLFILSLLGLALNSLVSEVRRRVLFWDPANKLDAVNAVNATAKKGGAS
jgi:NitT/TauT family transport system permease protein